MHVHVTYDLLTALTLWTAGAAGVFTWLRLGMRSAGSRYWLLAGSGLLYLGWDEHLSLHERHGDWLAMQGLELPGFHDVDGIVLIAFGLAGFAVSLWYWRELRDHSVVLGLLLTGAVAMVAAFALDDFGSNHGIQGAAEERLEWIASLFYLSAFCVRFWQASARTSPVSSPARATSEMSGTP